jgi:hypothetical protein
MRLATMLIVSATLLFVTALTATADDPPAANKRSAQGAGNARRRDRPGVVNTPPARGERHVDKLKAGDPAPDFTLPDAAGKRAVTLSDFRGKKPVVLVFGSYT